MIFVTAFSMSSLVIVGFISLAALIANASSFVRDFGNETTHSCSFSVQSSCSEQNNRPSTQQTPITGRYHGPCLC